MSSTNSSQESERRTYFRVKDEIVIFFNELNASNTENVQGFKNEVVEGFSLSAALNQLGEESRTQLKIHEKKHPELTAILRLLEKKIDLIAQAIAISDLALPSHPAREVDLSASGLAFASEKPIEIGTILELKMILPPSLVAIVARGKVVHCESLATKAKNNFGFKVALEFIDLAEYDRELLIRHIFKKQKSTIRKRKQSS